MEREKEREGGAAPSLVQFGLALGGAQPPLEALLSFPVWPIKAQYEFPYSPVLRKIHESLRTFLMFEYSLPIY